LEAKRLEKELHRKDKALAETAALLVLKKKARAILGGYREKFIMLNKTNGYIPYQ